ncbi:hypothetical protein X802_05650 [Thermococcus guaymasensis DSM 11113]|uniref:Uncharacterized protein n=1 Tax=Thermococcus guaymasensis DSM 11113 TaxID=1432656 RepID=A0A0X1KKB6_9EURY|nr:hypothetical protein [Thermococcus guaymasensis]AJC71708.1 hypothetical protein X802_05650 [Thermococcus guaymasensis DSM 11113]
MKRVSPFIIALLLSLLALPMVNAESGSGWVKSYGGEYGDIANAVVVAPNGDLIIAGGTDSFGAGSSDVWVLRLGSDGNVKWSRTYGGLMYDHANAVTVAPNGDIVLAGDTASFGAGSHDVWVLRLDRGGNVKWQKTYGGPGWEEAKAVLIAPNGDIIVAGYMDGDIWVSRLDANGNIKWQKTYGGNDEEEAYAIALAQNGDIIVVGYTYSFGAGAPFYSNVWVLRLDENGSVRWQKTYGGFRDDRAYAVAVTKNEDIVVAGYTRSFGSGREDVWVLRLDSDGNVKWQKTYGGDNNERAYRAVIEKGGDILIAGGTKSFGSGSYDAWVLRLDRGGNVKWQKTFGGSGSDWAYAVSIAPEGGVTVAGWTMSFGAGRGDAWILKLPMGGSGFSWFKSSFGFSSKDSNARVRDSNAQVETSSALESVPNIEVRNSKAEVLSEGITVKTQYPSDERILTILVLSFGVVAGATLYRARKRKGSSQG